MGLTKVHNSSPLLGGAGGSGICPFPGVSVLLQAAPLPHLLLPWGPGALGPIPQETWDMPPEGWLAGLGLVSAYTCLHGKRDGVHCKSLLVFTYLWFLLLVKLLPNLAWLVCTLFAIIFTGVTRGDLF